VHRILTNPFYAGFIRSKGELSAGRHEPALSPAEFAQVQRQLNRPAVERPKGRRFTYSGLIRCGECGRTITGEHKVNRHGTHYNYYHCAGRSRLTGCSEPSIQAQGLETQLRSFLARISLHEEVEPWIWAELALDDEAQSAGETARRHSLQSSVNAVEVELRELTSLRVRQLIDDEEFIVERTRLHEEADQVRQRLAEPPQADPFEPLREMISFSILALELFDRAGDDEKRLIVRAVCSNPSLKGKILSVFAAKPFVEAAEFVECLEMRRLVDDNRTLLPVTKAVARAKAVAIRDLLKQPEYAEFFSTIRLLMRQKKDQELPMAA
jgi:hypothetical protein